LTKHDALLYCWQCLLGSRPSRHFAHCKQASSLFIGYKLATCTSAMMYICYDAQVHHTSLHAHLRKDPSSFRLLCSLTCTISLTGRSSAGSLVTQAAGALHSFRMVAFK
jgi:hypothetical protein